LQARIAVPPFFARENYPSPRYELRVEGVTNRAKREQSGGFRGALSHAGTRKRSSDKCEQTPEGKIEERRKVEAHETPQVISPRHQEAYAVFPAQASRDGREFIGEVNVDAT
jgi:hypothetical protein